MPAVLNKRDLRGSPREVFSSLCQGVRPTTEGPSLMRRVVTSRSGRSPGLRVDSVAATLPVDASTVGFDSKSRLQWRYRGGLSPPSLFSLGGHLNGLCSIFGDSDDMAELSALSRGDFHNPDERPFDRLRANG